MRLLTLWALGPRNVARVAGYRLGLRAGLHPIQRISADPPDGPFFRPRDPGPVLPPPNRTWDDRLNWFGWYSRPLPHGAPDWHYNPFTEGHRADRESPWWRIADFGHGDIKGLWELSRFDWLVAFATVAAHGDQTALDRLNRWLADWFANNQAYRGANWKCGQEASIRVMHMLLAAIVLDQDRAPEPALTAAVATHLQRIAPTMSYAIAQQNNHGTSEAAAMFIGGDFLERVGDRRGESWSRTGRRWLEERARHLIAPDGSFSQYSVTYHRLALDSYALAEAWCRRHDLAPFSPALHARLAAATRWLAAFVDPASGDAPNLGANDGARLSPLTDTGYRDFRPSLQLAAALFLDARAIVAPGRWYDQPRWFGIDVPAAGPIALRSESFDDGGYHVLRAGGAVAYLRYPRFRFRPGQADALHLDLWVDGRNLLRDAGSFSYNASDGSGDFFAGTAAHNTVQFDGRDQMPRLGRFLFGGWLTAEAVEPAREDGERVWAGAGYTDRWGATHHRRVGLTSRGFVCEDEISGRFGEAVLRWRLASGDYRLEGRHVEGDCISLAVETSGALPALSLKRAPESLHYLMKADIPVLEIRVEGPCRIVTQGRF